jgi:hypothetical protein
MEKTKLQTWGVEELLRKYPGLRLLPTVDEDLRIAGTLEFSAQSFGLEYITDQYEIAMSVASSFPQSVPVVREVGGRVPKDFHKMTGGELCLGSPTRLRLILSDTSSLLLFIERCVIPYLYGYSLVEKGGTLPFGELAHGTKGLREDLADLIGFRDEQLLDQFVKLVSLKKRYANKRPCPCGSGLRVGRCHNRKLNLLRAKLGRRWFASLLLHTGQ